MAGTQVGILLPKYHVQPQSKCIMCRDCGIFFSHDAFLQHLHDGAGRRRECQSTVLELGIDNPGVGQAKAWQDFLVRLRGEHPVKRPRTSSYDPGAEGSRLHATANPPNSRPAVQPHKPAMHHSPRTSMHTVHRTLPVSQTHYNMPEPSVSRTNTSVGPPSSVSEFNRNIQRTVDASERLLRETSHYLASTEKPRHRRNRSANLDLSSDPPAARNSSRPQASRTLFDSGPLPAGRAQPAPLKGHLTREPRTTAANPPIVDREDEGMEDGTTARFPRDTRMFAGGDLPSSTTDVMASTQQRLNPDGDIAPLQNGTMVDTNGSRIQPEHPGSLRLNLPDINSDDIPLHERHQYKKEDPLFILQTAQELLALASHRIQALREEESGSQGNTKPPPSPGRDNEFLQLYHEERTKRRKFETQIQELQDSLREEQRQRKELEIQLRALNLQRS